MPESAHIAAVKCIRNMDDYHLKEVWIAIKCGGLDGQSTSNDIPVDDWIELIYLEMCDRGFAR